MKNSDFVGTAGVRFARKVDGSAGDYCPSPIHVLLIAHRVILEISAWLRANSGGGLVVP
jgi:hypothetical protein